MKDFVVPRDVLEALKEIAGDGIRSAAFGYSGMVGHKIEISNPKAHVVPLLSIPNVIGGPEDDAVGIYLRFGGDLSGQMMLIVPHPKALELVDLLMGTPRGTTHSLGSLEKSALGELGNLCCSFFLNAMAKKVEASFRPTPPAVMVDMVGAILDIVVASNGQVSDQILLMQANFMDDAHHVETKFWVIPDLHNLDILTKKTEL